MTVCALIWFLAISSLGGLNVQFNQLTFQRLWSNQKGFDIYFREAMSCPKGSYNSKCVVILIAALRWNLALQHGINYRWRNQRFLNLFAAMRI
jgi:hypothetical protein